MSALDVEESSRGRRLVRGRGRGRSPLPWLLYPGEILVWGIMGMVRVVRRV